MSRVAWRESRSPIFQDLGMESGAKGAVMGPNGGRMEVIPKNIPKNHSEHILTHQAPKLTPKSSPYVGPTVSRGVNRALSAHDGAVNNFFLVCRISKKFFL